MRDECAPAARAAMYFMLSDATKTTRAGMSLCERSSPRECPRPTEATKDTSCRCYLRGPDGVRRLSPSGTWDALEYSRHSLGGKLGARSACRRERLPRCHDTVVLRLLEERQSALIRMRVKESRQARWSHPLRRREET